MGELTSSGRSFAITYDEVWRAWCKVAANDGAAGVDGVSIAEFEADVHNNVYQVWNRLSSGTYFPPPVLACEIPKAHGGDTRTLGVPTVADRVAQTVVAARLSEAVEPVFHPDSYGYRPGRSALDAVESCKQRCWRYDWVVDLDIQKFFDTVPRGRIVTAVRAHTELAWVVLYVKRWLNAPLQQADGTILEREQGTPQGSAISPVLANLFLHHAFDQWLTRQYPQVAFERYVDDAVIHCGSEAQAQAVLAALHTRFGEVGLSLHPDKTRIVYCQDDNRRGRYRNTEFTFLGFTFRARGAHRKDGKNFTGFLPAVSKDALATMHAEVRSWKLPRRTRVSFGWLAGLINPIVRGWMNYYGAFYRSAMFSLLKRINNYLFRWVRNKYRLLRPFKAAQAKWSEVTQAHPRWLYHWRWVRAI